MHKALSVILLIFFSAGATATIIPKGGLCSGIAGPVGTCIKGTVCCNISPDNSICSTTCPP
ncbi:hypothetical protein M422DRAFT_25716 [Sphaerobolus stellatus SS14]|nr:hypothetical protein M422DRAFT_25716 [Sphaerobolus stellatus SS14]